MERMFLFFILLLTLPCCVSDSPGKFSMRPADLSYVEYVSESTGSFKEYLTLSNGMYLVKKHVRGVDELSVGKIQRDEALILMSNASSLIKEDNGIACSGCSLIQIFQADGRGASAMTVLSKDASSQVLAQETAFSSALNDTFGVRQFYLHFLFQKQGEDTVDYHFFPDGSVIRSVFGDSNGELKQAKFYSISEGDLKEIYSAFSASFFSSEDDLQGCVSKGLKWGTLEVYLDGRYALVNTCGTGQSAADTLFDRLRRGCGE